MKKRPVLDPEKLSKLETVGEYLDKKYGPVGTPERDKFIAETIAWYEQVCQEPDEEEVSERRWPRLRLFNLNPLRRVAAM